jgi:carboxyl-terminal processing protease
MLFPYQPFGKNELSNLFPNMKLNPSLLIFSFVGVAGLVLVANNMLQRKAAHEPDPRKEAVLVRSVIEGLNRLHFQPKAIDDNLSKQVYNLYLQDVDNGKRFFTQSEIQQLEKYQTLLDDQVESGTLDFFNLSVEMIDRSVVKTQQWYREILAKSFDFNKDEAIETDGKKQKWAKDDADLRNRWERLMKYEVLDRITDELDKQEKQDFKGTKKTFAQLEEEARKKVLDVYDKWFKRLQKNDRTRRLEIYLNSFTNVFDPHTGYYSPREKENFDIQMSGKLEGIGARLQSDGEKTSVSEIVPGGPAWKQGEVQTKDILLKVAQGDGEPVDVMGWDIDDVVAKVRGPKGTRVTLHIQKPDGAVKIVTIVRDVVIMEEGFAKSLITSTPSTTDKLGYIYLPKFYADFTPQGVTSCAADVAQEVDKLKMEGVKGIILDLRGNGGGSLRDVVQMSGLFIEQGPIVQVKSRNRRPEIMEDNDSRVQWSGPLVVMVNSFSASASEILAAAMQDYGRAVIVGSAGTYGKGTVQRFFDLDNATSDPSVKPLGEMKLTVQKFYRITGKTTQLDGVTPDITLPDAYNFVDLGERENDYPLQSNTIEAVPFNQSAYRIGNLNKLKEASSARVAQDMTFRKISENAERLRRQKEQSNYPLQADKYRQWSKKQQEESKRFEDMFQPISGLTFTNPQADQASIQSDTSRVVRNQAWIKEKQKDIQLYEAMRVLSDMLRMDAIAAGKQ